MHPILLIEVIVAFPPPWWYLEWGFLLIDVCRVRKHCKMRMHLSNLNMAWTCGRESYAKWQWKGNTSSTWFRPQKNLIVFSFCPQKLKAIHIGLKFISSDWHFINISNKFPTLFSKWLNQPSECTHPRTKYYFKFLSGYFMKEHKQISICIPWYSNILMDI